MRMVLIKKEKNSEQGVALDIEERILEDILGFFDKLCSKVEENQWLLEGLDWFPISEESASNLEWFLSEEKYEKPFFSNGQGKAMLHEFGYRYWV